MRTSEQVSALLADVAEERSFAPDSRHYCDGCAAALEWVTGQRRNGPVSVDEALSPSTSAASELRRAIAMLHGEEAHSLPTAYLSAVEATLAWVLGQTDEPPL